MDSKENVIEFLAGDKTATVTFTAQKQINRIKNLYRLHPEEFVYFNENKDGSVCAKIPLKWIKVSYPKQISEEQKQRASERFKEMWAKSNADDEN